MRQHILATGKTEGALKGADHRTSPVGWKGNVAALAGRLHEEHGQEFQQRGNMTITCSQPACFQELTVYFGDSALFRSVAKVAGRPLMQQVERSA
jgi:hypothetical protein